MDTSGKIKSEQNYIFAGEVCDNDVAIQNGKVGKITVAKELPSVNNGKIAMMSFINGLKIRDIEMGLL